MRISPTTKSNETKPKGCIVLAKRRALQSTMEFLRSTRERAPETAPLLPVSERAQASFYGGTNDKRRISMDEQLGSHNRSRFTDVSQHSSYPNADYHSDSFLSTQDRRDHRSPQHKPNKVSHNAKQVVAPSIRKITRKVPRKVKGHIRRRSIRREFPEDQLHRVSCYTEYPSHDVENMHRHISHRSKSFHNEQPNSKSHSGISLQSGNWDAQLVSNVLYLSMPGDLLNSPSVLTNKIGARATVNSTLNGDGYSPVKETSDMHDKFRSDQSSRLVDNSDKMQRHHSDDDNEYNDDHVDADDEDEHLGPLHRGSVDPETERLIRTRLEVFVFDYGSVVLWNFPSTDLEAALLRSLEAFGGRLLSFAARDSASDDMQYYFGSKSSVRNDCIELSTMDQGERLAVSFALSQSSQMSVYEWRIEETISRTEHIPKELAATGKIKMTQDQISREVGRLFIERNHVNLESDILDTPEYFWEDDAWEHVYVQLCEYLDQEKRIEILNRRLDCIGELLDVLNTQIENQHATKLEWIIIWLIVVEVVIQIVWNMLIKDILGFFP